jgi:hypothetical protein
MIGSRLKVDNLVFQQQLEGTAQGRVDLSSRDDFPSSVANGGGRALAG